MLLKGREFFYLWLYQQKCPTTLEKNSKAYKLVSLLILLALNIGRVIFGALQYASKILEVVYIKRPLYKYTAVQARD